MQLELANDVLWDTCKYIRCPIIGNELGFENIGVDTEVYTSAHGNEAIFELTASGRMPFFLA